MKPFRYDYAVIGGDLRQAYLAAELKKEGRSVCCYALCPSAKQISAQSIIPAGLSSLKAAISSAPCIICPIPLSRDKTSLNQSAIKKNIPLNHLLSLLSCGQHFFAGYIPAGFARAAEKAGVSVYDLMENDELSSLNTSATVEGVLCEAIKASPFHLHKSRCAVLGYGKCGRALADDLKSLSCHVTVFADPKEELEKAAVFANQARSLKELRSHIGEYGFIFNTIPAVVLTRDVLLCADPSAAILDIASSPGGIDFAAAEELSLNARSCPGLPGKYAPHSLAQAALACIKECHLPDCTAPA